MERRRQNRHFMPWHSRLDVTKMKTAGSGCSLTIDGIEMEEFLNLVCDFGGSVRGTIVIRAALTIRVPVVHEALEHSKRT